MKRLLIFACLSLFSLLMFAQGNIPCQNCKKEYSTTWKWLSCDKCGFRICQACLSKHKGKYGTGGYKCSQCTFGQIVDRQNCKTSEVKTASKIPCQNCGSEYDVSSNWYKCSNCDFRICPSCLSKHKGKYGTGGYKCSQCSFGQIKAKK